MKRNDCGAPSPRIRTEDNEAARDTLTKMGALALAKRLEKYWHDRDYPAARFWTEPIDERFAKVGSYEIYRVVCNLVSGLPPRYAQRQ